MQERDAATASAHGEMWMVVGFEVMPCSVKRTFGDPIQQVRCMPWPNDENPTPQEVKAGEDIVYSYDVYWQESEQEWASRWDLYLRMPSGSVHWFSILNSLLVVLVMSIIVAVILMRTVRRDLAKYEELLIEGQDSGKEESGWKLLSGDVFRAPSHVLDLAVQVCTPFCPYCACAGGACAAVLMSWCWCGAACSALWGRWAPASCAVRAPAMHVNASVRARF